VSRLFVCSCMAAIGALAGWAQPEPGPAAAFEVAVVKQLEKPLEPGQPDLSFVGTSGKPFQIKGNRVTARGTLRALIADAYAVKEYQVAGEPSWADSLIFVITAETPGAMQPNQDEVRPMLASLLAERFQVKFHRDTKEMSVYHMVRTKKSGLFKAAAPDEVFSWRVTPGPGGTLRSKAAKESIGDFVRLVGVSTDKPVIDRTGITGDIDYDILITLPEGDRRSLEDTNRAIVYAVVDQLGLKLESAKDRVDMLVLDRAARPSAN
jgi:uncharacterized protein (TIGR03435 family)